jgi:hypothetical protein
MAGLANSDEEHLALALSLSLLSSDDFDEQIAEPPPQGSGSANHPSRPRTPTSDEKDDLALRLSLLPPDDFDEQVARLHHKASASETRSPAPPNESDEDDLELALFLSQLPVDIFEEQVRALNQRRESRTAIGDSLASFLTVMSLVQVTDPVILIPW